MAQVQVLQAQLAAQGGSGTGTTTTTTTTAWCYTFTTNLSVGMTGPAVTALQTALQNDGESVTATGTFDDQTAAAVTSFQEKYASTILAPYGLSNGTGYAGKSTRAELNSLFGCTGSNPVTPTPPIHVCPVWGCNGPKPMPTSTPVTVGTTTPYISSFTVTPFSSNPGVYGMSSKYPNGYEVSYVVAYNFAPQPVTLTVGCASGLTVNTIDDGGNLQPFSCNTPVSGATGSQDEDFLFTNTSASTINVSVTLSVGGLTPVTKGVTIAPSTSTASVESINVTYPTTGGVVLSNGGKNSIATIQWTASNIPSGLGIALLNSAGTSVIKYLTNAALSPTTTSFVWANDPTLPSGTYQIEVYSSEKGGGAQSLSGPFQVITSAITTTSPSVTLTAPNGGQTYQIGSAIPISWNIVGMTTANNSIGVMVFDAATQAKIYLSQTVGDAVSASGVVSPTGTYNWTIPSTVPPGNYLAEVSWGNSYAQSKTSFAITAAATVSVPTVTFSANPTTITANPSSGAQPTTLTWSSTNATACTISGSHGYNDNGAWSQSGLAPSGSLPIGPYALSATSYTAVYQIICTGPGGTSQPASATVIVNPAPASTPLLSIFSVTGLQSSYQTNQPISFTLNGVQLPSNKPADSQEGFNVQAGGLPGVNGVNGSYNSITGLWNVTIPAPSTAGTYTLIAYLYCGNIYASCNTQYTNAASQVTKDFTINVVAAPVTTPVTTTQGTLSFSQSSFSANYTAGSPLPNMSAPYFQQATFTNTSNVSVNYTISVPNQPTWLNSGYATSQLTADPGVVTGIGAYLNPATVASTPGTYTTNIIITGNFVGSPMTLPVTLTVVAVQPTVSQVQGLTATGGNNSVSILWSPATATNGIGDYNIYRSTTAGFTPGASNMIAQTTMTAYVDSAGLQGGTTYYYAVGAQDVNGNVGAPSVQASAKLISGGGGAPSAEPAGGYVHTMSNALSSDTSNQTAIISQSLQGLLNQLSALLKSL